MELATAITRALSIALCVRHRLPGQIARQDGSDPSAEDGDAELATALLQLMRDAAADFTLTFRVLADALSPSAGQALREQISESAALEAWLSRWRERLERESIRVEQRRAAMLRINPAYIPRNHRVEAALIAATDGDLQPFHTLLKLLQRPFDEHAAFMGYRLPARPGERVLQTFWRY